MYYALQKQISYFFYEPKPIIHDAPINLRIFLYYLIQSLWLTDFNCRQVLKINFHLQRIDDCCYVQKDQNK